MYRMDEDLEAPHPLFYSSDFDSACSTPYVSAPSSPGRSSSAGGGGGYFYSAPTSPMHFFLLSSKQPHKPKPSSTEPSLSNSEFEFSARFSGEPSPAVSSADELFLNGQIRPMKLKSHLLNPQKLAPLIDLDEPPESESAMRENVRGREAKPSRRRTRSMSPLRKSMTWHRIKKEDDDTDNVDSMEKCGIKEEEEEEEEDEEEVVASMSASSSRSSSGGRNSKRWIFLKEFLYRSKSEGRNNNNSNNNNNNNSNNNNSNGTNSSKIWSKFSFSKKVEAAAAAVTVSSLSTDSLSTMAKESVPVKKKVGPTNGVGKRRVHLSAHEMHYKANRAQSEEMRKKTFLPYRQGLIGCLGFSSKGYGAVNGLARALNPVSSR